MAKVVKKDSAQTNTSKKGNNKTMNLIPTKVIADIVGTSESNVTKVRNGLRGKRSTMAAKIKYADSELEKHIAPKIKSLKRTFND